MREIIETVTDAKGSRYVNLAETARDVIRNKCKTAAAAHFNWRHKYSLRRFLSDFHRKGQYFPSESRLPRGSMWVGIVFYLVLSFQHVCMVRHRK